MTFTGELTDWQAIAEIKMAGERFRNLLRGLCDMTLEVQPDPEQLEMDYKTYTETLTSNEIREILLEVRDNHRGTIFHWIGNRYAEVTIKFLVNELSHEHLDNVLQVKNSFGHTALHQADLLFILWFVELEAFTQTHVYHIFSIQDNHGRTVIHELAQHGNFFWCLGFLHQHMENRHDLPPYPPHHIYWQETRQQDSRTRTRDRQDSLDFTT